MISFALPEALLPVLRSATYILSSLPFETGLDVRRAFGIIAFTLLRCLRGGTTLVNNSARKRKYAAKHIGHCVIPGIVACTALDYMSRHVLC